MILLAVLGYSLFIVDDPPEAQDAAPPDEGSVALPADPDLLEAFDDAGLADLVGPGEPDSVTFVQPDGIHDQNLCVPDGAMGADITGVAVNQLGRSVSTGVAFVESPLRRVESHSWAVVLEAAFVSGAIRTFATRIREGVTDEGEQDEAGSSIDNPDLRVSVDDRGVVFTFTIDPDDPLLYVSAFGYDLPEEDGDPACDEAFAAAPDLPRPPISTTGACRQTRSSLCLIDRFSVSVEWDNGAEISNGQGFTVNDDTTVFSFGATDSYEVLVRIINACGNDGYYWVIVHGLSDLEYTVTVADTATGVAHEYEHPPGASSRAIQDPTAFDTCP